MSVVNPHNGEGARWTVSGRPGRRTGTRFYLVELEDPAAAADAADLPAIGAAWSVDFPNLVVTDRVAEQLGGGPGPDGSGTHPGLCLVRVEYAEGGSGGGGFSFDVYEYAEDGIAWTQPRQGRRSIEIIEDIAGNAIPPTTIELAVDTYEVHAFFTTVAGANAAYAAYQAVRDRVNTNAVTLPNVVGLGAAFAPAGGTGSGLIVPAGSARMAGRDARAVREGLHEIVYSIELAADFKYRYRAETTAGLPTGPVIARDVYLSATWNTAALGWGA